MIYIMTLIIDCLIYIIYVKINDSLCVKVNNIYLC